MEISITSVLAAAIALSLLVLLGYFILKHNALLSGFGLKCFYGLLLLCVLRGFLPIEFYSSGLTKSYYSYYVLPALQDLCSKPVLSDATLSSILIFLWVAGGIVYMARLVWKYVALHTTLKRLPQVTEAGIPEILEKSRRAAGVSPRRPVKLVRTNLFHTPAVMGVFHPVVVLPDIEYSREELELVFIHELLHLRHGDFLIKLLTDVMAAIYWWNPLISRLLVELVDRIQELLVDRSMCGMLDHRQTVCYLECLKHTLEHTSETARDHNNIYYALADRSGKEAVRQRFHFIIERSAKAVSLAGIVISLGLILLSYTFIVEPSHRYLRNKEEEGQEVFKFSEDNSYYIKDGDRYELYIDGSYLGTSKQKMEGFESLPVYEKGEK